MVNLIVPSKRMHGIPNMTQNGTPIPRIYCMDAWNRDFVR
jgi:hypothetical protein